jgi:tRNA-dihydrouridine synthase
MIGRGAQGRPWVLAQVAAALHGTAEPDVPLGGALIDMVSQLYEAMLSFYGVEMGRKVSRKHMGWYMDDAGTPPMLRKAILTHADPAHVLRDLPDALTVQVAA